MKILRLMKGLRRYLVIMAIFSIIQAFSELYLPSIMSDIIDIGIESGDARFIINKVIIMLIISLVAFIANIIVVYSSSKFSNNYGFNIRDSLYKKINSLSKKEIDDFGASTLITRSTNNVSNITSTFSFGLRLMIFAPIMAGGAIIMGYFKARVLSPVIVLSIVALAIILLIIFLIIFPKFDIVQKLLDKLNSNTREEVTGIRTIKAFNKQDFFKKRFNKINNDNKELNIFLNKILYLIQPAMILIVNIATIGIIYMSIKYISLGNLEIGAMMAFIQYMATILTSFLIILVIILNIPRVMISFKRINEVLDIEVSVVDNGKIKLQSLESIEFKNVYFRYPKAKKTVLKDISFRIKKGENVGIIGSSGSGKTTIVNLLLRNIDATKGTILINGIDIKEYTKESLRKIFAYVPQKTLLFKGSVKENIGFDNKYDLSELDKVMHTARLKDVVLKNKEGFNYELEQSGINLSCGQKQRISIARALLNGGECLIFDDSFSSVDYITDRKIRQSLAKNYQDKMTILITQRMGTVKDTNKIIVIEEGKVEAIGTYKELTRSSSVFKEFISSQKSEVKE